jgi:26S proteasome regulatory subunit N1
MVTQFGLLIIICFGIQFQTHQTPVRIGTGERAEFGTNEFFPYASVLENLVIIKKNEAYEAEDA